MFSRFDTVHECCNRQMDGQNCQSMYPEMHDIARQKSLRRSPQNDDVEREDNVWPTEMFGYT